MNQGSVSEIVGVVVDVDFADGELPAIRNALEIARGEGERLVLEVQQHLGENRVRCVAMDATDGLTRGVEVVDTGGPITVPVGKEVLGRLLNVTGDPIDGKGAFSDSVTRMPIHRPAPAHEELVTSDQMLETRRRGSGRYLLQMGIELFWELFKLILRFFLHYRQISP